MKRFKIFHSFYFVVLTGFATILSGEIIRWDVSGLNLITPPSEGDETNFGNTAIGVWFNMTSGEAYVVEDIAGIVGKTDLADGRFQLRWTTYWELEGGLPSSDVLVQGELPFNTIHGISTATPEAAAGSPARFGPGEPVPTGPAFNPVVFVEMAGTFGIWNDKGRGFLGLRFLVTESGFNLHYGYADVTILDDGRLRLNGFAYNSEPNQTLVTEYIGAAAPEPAANLQVISSTATTVELGWEDRSQTEAGFIIERKGPQDADFVRIATTLPDETRFSDQNLASGTGYQYRVVATTGLDADPSNVVSVTTQTVDAPPAAPELVSVSPLSPARMLLEWADNSDNETGFRIERQEDGGSWGVLETVGAGITSYIDRGLQSDTLYGYRITAINGLDSNLSSILESTTFSPRESAGIDALVFHEPTLDGNAVTFGLWDFAPALSTHLEFSGGGLSTRRAAKPGLTRFPTIRPTGPAS